MLIKNKFLLFVFSIVLIQAVSAEVGILDPQIREIKFDPGLEVTYMYYFYADRPVTLSAEGDFKEFVHFDKTNFNFDSQKEIATAYMTIKLPQETNLFGRRDLWFTVTEEVPKESGGGAYARGAVKDRIVILVPYPGKYLEGKLTIPPVKVNEPLNIDLWLLNLGTEKIDNINSIFKIYLGDELLTSINGESISLVSKEERTISVKWDTKDIKAGRYTVKAFITYDEGRTLNLTGDAFIGDLLIDILDYSQYFIENKISPFYVNVTSLWNEIINGIYAKIDVYENESVKKTIISPTIQLRPWETKSLMPYLDTYNLSLGEHAIKINVFYENKTAIKQGQIFIEKEKIRTPMLTTSTLLILAVILLILLNIIILILYASKKRKDKIQ